MAGELLLKGLCIGLLFGIPVGAVGVLTVQRTLAYGMKAGIATGLGSSAADGLYACAGAFGMAAVSDFLLEHRTIVNLAGGCLLLLIGLRVICKKTGLDVLDKTYSQMPRFFFSAFAIGLANPAAILMLLFAFSYFGIYGKLLQAEGIVLSVGVFFGTLAWWVFLSGITAVLGHKLRAIGLRRLNQGFGTLLILLGLGIFIKTLYGTL